MEDTKDKPLDAPSPATVEEGVICFPPPNEWKEFTPKAGEIFVIDEWAFPCPRCGLLITRVATKTERGYAISTDRHCNCWFLYSDFAFNESAPTNKETGTNKEGGK